MENKSTFNQIAELWRKDKSQYVKRSTLAAYDLHLTNHLLPYFGQKTEVREKDVQEFVMEKLNCGLSTKYVKDMLIVLKMVLKYGASKELTTGHHINVHFPTERTREDIAVLHRRDQLTLLEHTRTSLKLKDIGIYICLSSGIRIGEVCALTWKDIDMQHGTISINKTIQRIYTADEKGRHTELVIGPPKTKDSIREIPMTHKLMEKLCQIRKGADDRCYVLTGKTKPTEPRTYRNYYMRLLTRLGIPAIKFHCLRHSFATRCIESECDYKTVSVLLGHSDIRTTLNLYVHPNMEQKQRCIEKMFSSLRCQDPSGPPQSCRKVPAVPYR